jgi:hypothetical protein
MMRNLAVALVAVCVISYAAVFIYGCATTKLVTSDKPLTTPTMISALCADAKMGVAMAKVALPLVSGSTAAYWESWRVGAEVALNAACSVAELSSLDGGK